MISKKKVFKKLNAELAMIACCNLIDGSHMASGSPREAAIIRKSALNLAALVHGSRFADLDDIVSDDRYLDLVKTFGCGIEDMMFRIIETSTTLMFEEKTFVSYDQLLEAAIAATKRGARAALNRQVFEDHFRNTIIDHALWRHSEVCDGKCERAIADNLNVLARFDAIDPETWLKVRNWHLLNMDWERWAEAETCALREVIEVTTVKAVLNRALDLLIEPIAKAA